MDEARIHAIDGLVFLAVLWLLPTAGRAATITVDCSSTSLQAAIEKVNPGDTLVVSGTCSENLVVKEEIQKITLDGQGKARISGSDKGKDTILVYGRGITIKGLTITGGRDGIHVLMGGTALVDGNTIEKVGRFGVYEPSIVRRGSSTTRFRTTDSSVFRSAEALLPISGFSVTSTSG